MNWNHDLGVVYAPESGAGQQAASGGAPAGPSGGAPAAGANGLDQGHGLSQGARPGNGLAGPGAVADPTSLPAGGGAFAVPDFIPQHLRDDDPAKFAAKVAEDWKRQRDDIAKRGAPPPKDPGGYVFKPSDKSKGFVGNLDQDPVFLAFRDQAHKSGMAPQVFQELLGGFYDTLTEKGVLGVPYDASRERRSFLGDDAKTMSDDQTIEAMRPHIAAAETFLNGLGRNGTLQADNVKALEPLLETAVGLRTLTALRHAMGQRGLALGGDAPGDMGGLTRSDLQARMRDPRNDRSSGKYDAKFAAQIDADYKRLFGGPS